MDNGRNSSEQRGVGARQRDQGGQNCAAHPIDVSSLCIWRQLCCAVFLTSLTLSGCHCHRYSNYTYELTWQRQPDVRYGCCLLLLLLLCSLSAIMMNVLAPPPRHFHSLNHVRRVECDCAPPGARRLRQRSGYGPRCPAPTLSSHSSTSNPNRSRPGSHSGWQSYFRGEPFQPFATPRCLPPTASAAGAVTRSNTTGERLDGSSGWGRGCRGGRFAPRAGPSAG